MLLLELQWRDGSKSVATLTAHLYCFGVIRVWGVGGTGNVHGYYCEETDVNSNLRCSFEETVSDPADFMFTLTSQDL